MKLKSLDIPNDISQLGNWLDDQLVSPELMDTIMELEILAGERLTYNLNLNDISSDLMPEINARGINAASPSAIRQLLRQPTLLLELQESVLTNGGDYWQQKLDKNYQSPTGLNKLLNTLGTTRLAPVDAAAKATWNRKRILGLIAAIAATILLTFAIWPDTTNNHQTAQDGKLAHADNNDPTPSNPRSSKPEWGFAASGLLNLQLAESEMLRSLSQASLTWYNKVPATNDQLEIRLEQFDRGCRELLEAELPQLSAQNRKAVHQACKTCRASIAQLLAELNRNADFDVTLLKADATIERLSQAIKKLKT